MGRIIRTQLAEAVVGLVISTVLAHFGHLAAFTGLTGTGVVMAVTALAARSAKLVLAVVALVIPFASVTALETSLDTSLTAIAHGPSDEGGVTTVRAVYDKYRAKVATAPDTTPTPTTGPGTIDPDAGAGVSPASVELSCLGKECRQEVTITSTGAAPLRLTSMTFEGAGAAAWHRSGDCEYKVIQPDQDCRLRVWAVRSDEPTGYTAQLVVHQNAPGPASRVDLTAPADTPSPAPGTTDSSRRATLTDAGSTGIAPADCSALDGSVTVLAADGTVEWSAGLGGTADASGSDALSGVIVDPPSGSVPAGERQTIAVHGTYTGSDEGFQLSIRYADKSVDFHVGC
ncbi:hypothetical protein [Streptomyces triticiradicis]|uniref:Uncharacterized protein n=1 Tax=Streptomyces triticiradicis TaxID=2651189 RepID=A0A7J5DB53_9ACTN|nr:hypothetical protein [Streptomyces triticiradicis]KAB1985730.1 hypothetical protein F8144_25970 [Streptomyces triticiradicis]